MTTPPTPLPAESLAEPVTEAPAVTAVRLRRVRCCPDCWHPILPSWRPILPRPDALLDWMRL